MLHLHCTVVRFLFQSSFTFSILLRATETGAEREGHVGPLEERGVPPKDGFGGSRVWSTEMTPLAGIHMDPTMMGQTHHF